MWKHLRHLQWTLTEYRLQMLNWSSLVDHRVPFERAEQNAWSVQKMEVEEMPAQTAKGRSAYFQTACVSRQSLTRSELFLGQEE
jgi:hypothetical protein